MYRNYLCIIIMIGSWVEFRCMYSSLCYYRNSFLYKGKRLALSGNYTPRAAFLLCLCHSAALKPVAEKMDSNSNVYISLLKNY